MLTSIVGATRNRYKPKFDNESGGGSATLYVGAETKSANKRWNGIQQDIAAEADPEDHGGAASTKK